jgi:hypothetical protein
MASDSSQSQTPDVDALTGVRAMRAGLIREIAIRERELAALRAKLAGVDMVFAECGIPPAERGDG